MKTYYSYIVIACVGLATINWSICSLDAQVSTNPPPPLPDSFVSGLGATNSLEANTISNRVTYLNQFTNEVALRAVYDKNLISKGEFIWVEMQWENAKSQDIYGKVIDQAGNPIAGVNVTGSVARRQGWYMDDRWEKYKTQTDTDGLFQFTGLRGADWAINVEKQGYEMDYGRGWSGPRGGPRGTQTSPNNRAILTMWKVKGAEPMIHDQKFYGITPNGSTFTIDLVNKNKIEGTNAVGDLLVQIQRPNQIKPRENFDWSFVMTAIGGGVIEVTNVGYLNEAPENGYQPSYKVNMSATGPNWQEQIEKTFYLKSRNGQVYGHFSITIIPNYNNTSIFKIGSYINPAGSRNLEFDPKKQIR